MIFVYSQWAQFCKKLSGNGVRSTTACDVLKKSVPEPYIILKHDVETAVSRAHKMAEIEQRYGHRGSYYVQAYLLNNEKNVLLLQQMAQMGHEISYHYDVLDSNLGNMEKACEEFGRDLALFRACGFECATVCQHGNPVVNRVGYHSNRDFFRDPNVQQSYSEMTDIMVDFKAKAGTDYLYFSDAGRKFNLIFDPINNDIVSSDDKNVSCDDLDEVMNMISESGNGIISVHPHRWTSCAATYRVKTLVFKTIRFVARKLMKIPVFKKIMGRYYYLAKKI